jgi:hypothetical protein
MITIVIDLSNSKILIFMYLLSYVNKMLFYLYLILINPLIFLDPHLPLQP